MGELEHNIITFYPFYSGPKRNVVDFIKDRFASAIAADAAVDILDDSLLNHD